MSEVKLIEGQMYTVKYKFHAGNNRTYVREFCATFMWESADSHTYWNFRPVAGTSECLKSDILDIRESDPGESPMAPKSLGEFKPEDWS